MNWKYNGVLDVPESYKSILEQKYAETSNEKEMAIIKDNDNCINEEKNKVINHLKKINDVLKGIEIYQNLDDNLSSLNDSKKSLVRILTRFYRQF